MTAASGILRKFSGGRCRGGKKKNQKEQPASASTVHTVVETVASSKTLEPPRKRKSADRAQIIVSCPPWKPPCVGDIFPNLKGLHTISTKQDGIRTLPGFDYYDYLAAATPDHDDNKNNSAKKWGIVVVFPGRAVSPVCISELEALSKLSAELKISTSKVKVCGFTANPRETNRSWIEEVERSSGCVMNVPLFCDNSTFDNAVEMGTLDEDKTSEYDVPILYRSTFIIRPDRTIAMLLQQASNVGRDFRCILQFVESLQKGSVPSCSYNFGGEGGDELVLSS